MYDPHSAIDPFNVRPRAISVTTNSDHCVSNNASQTVVTDSFNQVDCTVFVDGPFNDMVGSSQAAINAVLPLAIQNSFDRNDINYYDPGYGGSYYAKSCNGYNCSINQVSRSCRSFLVSSLELMIPCEREVVPDNVLYTVQKGEELSTIATKFDTLPELIEAANRGVADFKVGQTLHIPAQVYEVRFGDTLSLIAQNLKSTLSALILLNPSVTDPNFILTGQLISVPARFPNTPFSHTVREGEFLSMLADLYGASLSSMIAANPEIFKVDMIFPDDVLRVPHYLPVKGTVTYSGRCFETCYINSTPSLTNTAAPIKSYPTTAF